MENGGWFIAGMFLGAFLVLSVAFHRVAWFVFNLENFRKEQVHFYEQVSRASNANIKVLEGLERAGIISVEEVGDIKTGPMIEAERNNP